MPTNLLPLLFCLMVLWGCAAPPNTVAPPVHEAGLYPDSRTAAGLSVAVDGISDAERQRLFFGRELADDDVLPVLIIVTNNGEDTFRIRPSDVLVYRGKTIVDPVQPPQGTPVAAPFGQASIAPGSTWQGMLFYPVAKNGTGWSRGWMEDGMGGGLVLRMIALDQDSGEQIRFGPFTVTGW